MANTKQAKKRARQVAKRRLHTATLRSQMRTSIKKALTASEGADKKAAEQALREAASVIDSVSQKGIIHRNAAARYKSRLSRRLRADTTA